MISKLIESFVSELQKDENQEYINDVINPYLTKYKYYLCLITFILFIIAIATLYNLLVLYKLLSQKFNL